MYPNFIKVIFLTIVVSITPACTTPTQNQVASEDKLISEDKTLVDSNNSVTNKPPNKTGTISVEGEKTNITLKLYQEKNLFSTYFPEEDFLVQPKDTNKGKGVKFIANFGGVKNENAYLKFIFPDDLKTLEEIRNFVNGKNGIIASNKWKVGSRTENLPYPWAKEQIAFSKGQDIIGNIYLGEQEGKVFYVITHFPIEYGDGFSPRADLILSNLEISE